MNRYLVATRQNRKLSLPKRKYLLSDRIAGQVLSNCEAQRSPETNVWLAAVSLAIRDLFDIKVDRDTMQTYSTPEAMDAYMFLFGRHGANVISCLGMDVKYVRALLERECLINHDHRIHPGAQEAINRSESRLKVAA